VDKIKNLSPEAVSAKITGLKFSGWMPFFMATEYYQSLQKMQTTSDPKQLLTTTSTTIYCSACFKVNKIFNYYS